GGLYQPPRRGFWWIAIREKNRNNVIVPGEQRFDTSGLTVGGQSTAPSLCDVGRLGLLAISSCAIRTSPGAAYRCHEALALALLSGLAWPGLA
ncbi:hypothetical protein FZEAL_10206, partial [Fusarium zealandicum]